MRTINPAVLPAFLLAASLHTATAYSAAPVERAPKPQPKAATAGTQLPVTRVALYKNGVGFFEHSGHVTGDQSVTIDFTTGQLNDVLQSLTAIDLNGGRISGAGYNSTTPLDQQLKALPLALGQDPSAADFYNAIRGARVEVHSPTGTLAGRLLSFEVRTTPGSTESAPSVEKHFLTVASDAGAIRTFELTPATEVRLLDTALHTDVTRYLELIAGNRNQGLRHLTLQDNGTGARDLRISYISEVPIWKSTYRILFTDPATRIATGTAQSATLQGWSVVDNTTGSDWNHVQLSLIAGSPQSFIQPISQPIYSRRPEIPIAQEAQLTPQTHESGDKALGTAVAGMSGLGSGSGIGIGAGSGGNIGSSLMSQDMSASGTVLRGRSVQTQAGVMCGIAKAPAPTVQYESTANSSIAPNTTTNAFDDYFEYKLTEPVTIRKNESALVPILQTKINAERVTLWSTTQRTPLRALWVTNTSNLTLDRGSFAIIENGNFGGEGLLDPIHPSERRLLSYAADQAVRVNTESVLNSSRATSITASKGVLVIHRSEVAELTYVVHNAATEPRAVILEHPVRLGFQLDSVPKPEETTSSVYRFRVTTAPGETERLHVGEKRTLNNTYQLTRSDDNQLTFILNQTNHNPAITQALQPILDARRGVADAQTALNTVNERLTTLHAEEERQRANIVALKDADKSARQRFVNDLNTTEDQIAQQQKEQATRDAQLKAAQQYLANKIELLQIDQTL